MRYFNEFPVIDYNLTGINGNSKKVTDIFRRVKVRSKIANNLSLFDKIDVPEGDNPEEGGLRPHARLPRLPRYHNRIGAGPPGRLRDRAAQRK